METVENQDLKLAFDFVQYTNRNIFLTGKAGTGKTTFLRELRKLSPKRQVIVAPTGVAAINAGGVTIHSFFQLPFYPFIPNLYLPGSSRPKIDGHGERDSYKMSREKINIIKSLDLLIIDEISMVRADTLDAIDSALRRYRVHNLPFGGIQLLMIGDLQQLAPVVKDEDREILSGYYNSYFFFGSRALQNSDYVTIELKHIYRQTDQDFIRLLNKVRDNHVDSEVLDELNKRYIPDFDPDSGGRYITLTTHNNQARTINESRLGRLSSEAHSFTAVIKDEFPELSYPNDAELILKKGAQVMFVKNDLSPEKLYYNGKIGVVESFEEESIVVRCPGDDYEIYVGRAEWQNMKYTLDEETRELEETILGTFTQYPLRLAWAITIHKSQGLTFDRAVIDARSAFAHGQVYVALSRCRTLNGIVLSSRIDHSCIIDNVVISDFIKDSVSKQPGPVQLAESKNAYLKLLISELFDFRLLHGKLSYSLKLIDENAGSIIGTPLEMLRRSEAGLKSEIMEVSGKFQTQLNDLSTGVTDIETNTILQDRVKKAAVFFSEKLEFIMKDILNGFSVETDNRMVRKSVNESLGRVRMEAVTKLACLETVKDGFQLSSYLDARAKASIEIPARKKSSDKTPDTTSNVSSHPELFDILREWRNSKAREAKLAHYRILHQKTLIAISNALPTTIDALIHVKGIGRRKAEKYGAELITIISSFCKGEKIDIPVGSDVETVPGKPLKVDTRKISFELFNAGNTIAQIAELRKLTTSTIENHLAAFVESGELPIKRLVSEEMVELITECFETDIDIKMGEVKEILGEEVSWGEIRLVRSHLAFLKMFNKQPEKQLQKNQND